jgi:hypothetical protein
MIIALLFFLYVTLIMIRMSMLHCIFQEIFPIILKQVPKVRLFLVGKDIACAIIKMEERL